jgi:hypothetical protein
MDNICSESGLLIICIIIVIVLVFIFFVFLKPLHKYYSKPNYHIYYTTHNDNKQHFEILDRPVENMNTESITIGGHNSSHNSPIIASPYNPAKNIFNNSSNQIQSNSQQNVLHLDQSNLRSDSIPYYKTNKGYPYPNLPFKRIYY